MAAAAVVYTMPSLHPFFKPIGPAKNQDEHVQAVIEQEQDAATDTHLDIPTSHDDAPYIDTSPVAKRGRGKGRGRGGAKATTTTRRKATANKNDATDDPVEDGVKQQLDFDSVENQSNTRRKRRRLSDDGPVTVGVSIEVGASSPPPYSVQERGQGSEDMIVAASSPSHLPSSQPETLAIQAAGHVPESSPVLHLNPNPVAQTHNDAPKKMMKLKAGGRLASPVEPLLPTKDEAF